MKRSMIYSGILLAVLFSCSRAGEKIEGEWQIVSIAPSDSIESGEERVALLWLNVLSDTSRITFKNDSLFINGNFRSKYKMEDNSVYSKKEDSFHKTFDHSFKKDTLILKNQEETVTVKLKKVHIDTGK